MTIMDRARIHVICAPPNGRNPGMTSVDLAFAKIAQATGIEDVTYWRLWDVTEWRQFRDGRPLASAQAYTDPDTGMTYRPLRDNLDEALDADRVVYWGDFMHMAVYQDHMADVLARRIGVCSRAEADEIVARALLLRGADESTLNRVFSYGSTLGMNTPADYAAQYGRDLEGFLAHVNGVWLRDPYSAEVARAIRGPERGSAQGLDAAFLLHDGRHRGGGGLGLFIGRSEVQPEAVASFGRQLAKRLQMNARWIPWGDEPAFWPVNSRRRFRAAWPALEHADEHLSRPELLRASLAALRGVPKADQAPISAREVIDGIGDFDVILTDTYHLAINAWAQGVPAICLVDEGGQNWSVNSGEPHMRRDKRVDLYSQLDALGLIVDLAGLGHRIPQEIERIVGYLGSRDVLDVTLQRISAMRAQSIASVSAALGRVGAPT